MSESQIRDAFNFLCQKYIQKSDLRQKAMGLQYTEAETHDLAKEITNYISKSTFFHELRQSNLARDKEWLKDQEKGFQFSLSFRGNELAGEVGEACNILKKLDREHMGIVGSRATLSQLKEELADVFICLDLICMDLDISPHDIQQMIKLKFNKTSQQRNLKTMF
jgi:NTP pyrophosphatase (non-canonical NTP hydrolase)